MIRKFLLLLSLTVGVCVALISKVHSEQIKPDCARLPSNSGIVEKISDHNVIMLKDGRQLVIANIYLNKEKSNKFLKQYLINKRITFYPSGRLKDRYNRLISQITFTVDERNVWLQQSLISKALGAAIAFPNNKLCSKELLNIEREYRSRATSSSNPWSTDKPFPILNSKNIEVLKTIEQGSFQIVKGKVVAISRTSKNTYINFSKNWRTDFTVIISNHLLKRKKSKWPKLKPLIGKTIIVRGWLDHWYGPMIRLETPEMLHIE